MAPAIFGLICRVGVHISCYAQSTRPYPIYKMFYLLSVVTHSSKHLFQVIQHDTWFTYPLMKEDPAVDMFIIITGVGTNSTGSVDDLVACYGGRLCR